MKTIGIIMKHLGFYTQTEHREHDRANDLPTDAQRQTAYAVLNVKVRRRLKVPVNRYLSFTTSGEILLDEKRERPKPIKKISKSDQP